VNSGEERPPGRDTIYAGEAAADGEFRFDARVASVFADMIGRSVPGYALTLQMLAVAARRFARAGTRCYDLGCSLGASTLSIARHAPAGTLVIGVDNSPQMLERARAIIDAECLPNPVELRCEDLRCTALADASLVALNFTLQFVPPAERLPLLAAARAAIRAGGCLVLSEKLAFEDAREQELLIGLHHDFKALQGYSALEIARKRAALENVLVPETLQAHRARLREAGFRHVTVWLQCLNFVSLLAEP
jgi:tRNA (cmo5U34)-methyltransferase